MIDPSLGKRKRGHLHLRNIRFQNLVLLKMYSFFQHLACRYYNDLYFLTVVG